MFPSFPGLVAECGFDSMEVLLKYEDISIPLRLNEDLMQKSILEIKKSLLSYHPDLGNVKEKPEQLGLYAVFSADLEERKELGDHIVMEEYKDVITKCQMLVLERRTPTHT